MLSIQQVVTKATTEKPAAATHWSARAMARAVGIAVSSVQKIWKAHGLKPHLVRSFKLSNDPAFQETLVDIVGLYLDPPDRALVLSVDEKSQIQALDRTQSGMPLKKGRAGTMTHDYERHGTTTLFAALDAKAGTVIGPCVKRHRHQEFIRFLGVIGQRTPADLDLHLVVGNYATHKHPAVKAWLAQHPRFHLDFTPTSSSWLNLVERFFAEITRKRIRRGAFRSVIDLEVAIHSYLAEHNDHPKPFVWTAKPLTSSKKCNAGSKRWSRNTRSSRIESPPPPPRLAYFGPDRDWIETPVLRRSDLARQAAGPLIVEEYDATCLVLPGWQGRPRRRREHRLAAAVRRSDSSSRLIGRPTAPAAGPLPCEGRHVIAGRPHVAT
jgi:transposase